MLLVGVILSNLKSSSEYNKSEIKMISRKIMSSGSKYDNSIQKKKTSIFESSPEIIRNV